MPEIGAYTSFGIAAYQAVPGQRRKLLFISDISPNESFVRQLAEACSAAQLFPSQLMDVVEDLLAQ